MGSFAGMLKAAGYEVTGSDENVYPPMSDMLAAWGVQVMTPYSPANLDAARPDLVIIGNVIRRVNPEATAVRERGIPQMSFPRRSARSCSRRSTAWSSSARTARRRPRRSWRTCSWTRAPIRRSSSAA
jgi:UDP-N-acetylmuramate-alanine ligase